ncbi:MAG: hypothetical protein GXX85_05420 [Ignavibacteria bacterium]|nr:hypothetical protein [Ignavibacteria bacterium]
MKKKVAIFLLLFCFIPLAKLYAQQTEEEAIDTLLKTTKNFRKEIQNLSLHKGSINEQIFDYKYTYEEVLEGARALYKFNRAYPKSTKLGVLTGKFVQNKNIGLLINKNKYKELADTVKKYPGAEILSLKRQMRKYFNDFEERFINSVDGIIIGEILSIDSISCISDDLGFPLELLIYKVKVDEIIDGLEDFKQGDIIKVWVAIIWGIGIYEQEKKYLLPLWYRDANDSRTPPMSVYCNFGDRPTIFSIQENLLIDGNNTFGLGYEVKLDSIKNYIIDLRNKLLSEGSEK